MTEEPDPTVVSALPDRPVPEPVLHALDAHEAVVDVVPTKLDRDADEAVLVHDFVLELADGAHALRYEAETGWTVFESGDDVEAVALALQEYEEEHDL